MVHHPINLFTPLTLGLFAHPNDSGAFPVISPLPIIVAGHSSSYPSYLTSGNLAGQCSPPRRLSKELTGRCLRHAQRTQKMEGMTLLTAKPPNNEKAANYMLDLRRIISNIKNNLHEFNATTSRAIDHSPNSEERDSMRRLQDRCSTRWRFDCQQSTHLFPLPTANSPEQRQRSALTTTIVISLDLRTHPRACFFPSTQATPSELDTRSSECKRQADGERSNSNLIPKRLVMHQRTNVTSSRPRLRLEDYVAFPEYLDLTPFLAPREGFRLGLKAGAASSTDRGGAEDPNSSSGRD
ncbi:hypothetical protein GYMLUDRAFT_245387 [Collybiopsis luxurians FD-317 M1]|uniref:Uncharacterized protein n=1 Tax=Collybiopsis luxurians FD-317 M1 TaxID=944289 RepID=A0A0D0CL89_9AGAR|nr:hypothetical protein GYMLUDRAFT_245387 [Collybiopsis luxurians FD-317 M1]